MLLKTALYNSHKNQEAKIVPFAGYEMPLFYSLGMIKEQEWVRNSCGLFDVSHMGQVVLTGDRVDELLSYLTPTDFTNMEAGKAKYTVFLNGSCGIIDDLIATKISDSEFFLVINASRKDIDIEWLNSNINNFECYLEVLNRSLIAIQGVFAQEIISKKITDVANLSYMSLQKAQYNGQEVYLSRLGYTGEDGFEISVVNDDAEKLWLDLLQDEKLKPVGLGARDGLRLEMGYPLYGNDLTEDTNLGELTMKWVVTSDKDFIGKANFITEPTKRRTSIKLLDKGVIREGMEVYNEKQEKIGVFTSAGYSSTLSFSIGMAKLDINYAKAGTKVLVKIRDKFKQAEVHKLAFIEAKTKK